MTDAVREPGPSEVRDPEARAEIRRAGIWFAFAGLVALLVILIQPLLVILAGVIFAVILDGGTRLLGRVLPIGRAWRLTIIVLLAVAAIVGRFVLTGVQVAAQFAQLRETVTTQGNALLIWASQTGIMPERADIGRMAQNAMGSIGRVTGLIGSAFGALSTLFLIAVIGLFLAMEPRLYERGVQWMLPQARRREAGITLARMGGTLRHLMAGRLLGMLVQGVATWIALEIGGVQMALILGILTGVLAFIPNIGAIISGLLMVAVGFSTGVDTGLWALGTYLIIQTLDGYVLTPYIARRTVDVAPALVLGAQILFGALFGIFGIALADPITAMLKVALERRAEKTGPRETG